MGYRSHVASRMWIIIESVIGLSPIYYQVITWTSGGILQIKFLDNTSEQFESKDHNIHRTKRICKCRVHIIYIFPRPYMDSY